MRATAPRSFGAHLKALREVAGFTQEELATIAGLSVHAINALERGERRRPQLETVRALSAALELPEAARDEFRRLARPAARISAPKGSGGAPLPLVLTSLVGARPTCTHWSSGSVMTALVPSLSSAQAASAKRAWRWSSRG